MTPANLFWIEYKTADFGPGRHYARLHLTRDGRDTIAGVFTLERDEWSSWLLAMQVCGIAVRRGYEVPSDESESAETLGE